MRMWLPFKYVKYLLVPILLSFVFVKLDGKIKIPIKEKSAWIFMIINVMAAFFSLDMFVSLDRDGFEVVKKYMFCPLLIICFYHSSLFKINAQKLISFFSDTMVAFAMLSVFFYFVRVPIWNDFQRFYWGRITVGYPTIDAVNCVIAISVLMLCFGKESKISFWFRLAKIYILAVFVILQTSGTGIGLLCALVAYCLALPFFKKWIEQRNIQSARKILLPLLLMFLLSASFIVGFLKIYDAKLLENMTLTVENRVAILTNDKYSDLDVNTMMMRVNGFEKVKKLYMKNNSDFLFGKGFGLISYDPRKIYSGFRVFLESQWYLSIFSTGYIGTFFLLLFFVELIKKSMKGTKMSSHTLFSVICIFASMFTSCTLMSFALVGSFSLFYSEDKQRLQRNAKCLLLE